MTDYTHGEYEISDSQKKYYTPTTEEVRNRFTFHASGIRHPEFEEQFDRWLAEMKAEAVNAYISHNASDVGLDMPTDTETIEHVGDIVNGYK